MTRITKRQIEALKPPAAGELFIWDETPRGFGVRMMASGVASYLIQYRTPQGKTRRLSFARVGTLTLDEARDRARRLLGDVADGRDPSDERHQSREDITWEAVCDAYMEAARAGKVATARGKAKRASTVAIDEGRVSRHMTPLIGRKLAKSITRAVVQKMHDDIAAGKTAGEFKTKARGVARVTGGNGTAGRVVELLGGIWTWAEKRGLVIGDNPARSIDKIKGEARDRVLTADELARLGSVLRAKAGEKPHATAALRLIALTGLRREEACGLRWDEVSFAESCLRLKMTKTGRSKRVIGAAAIQLLKSLPRSRDFVFPSAVEGKSADLKKPISDLFDAAGLDDARSHDLRRTFASIADDEGYGVAAIGEMLGHARRGVTDANYIRRPDATMIEAVSRVAARVAAALDKGSADVVQI